MFTGLQRKRPLFFTPQRLNVTFALRPGRNGCFFLKRSLVCSENVDFFHLQRDLSDFWATFALRPGRNGYVFLERSLVCSENDSFFHPLGDLKYFCQRMFTGLQPNDQTAKPKIAECHWSAAKTRSVFELQRTCFFFISINLQSK